MEDIIILKFYAPWCKPCNIYARTFIKVVDKLGVPYQEINVDEHPDLMNKYGVSVLPTTIVLKSGEVSAKREGTLLNRQLEELILQEVTI